MKHQPVVYIDQYGNQIIAVSVADLRRQCDNGKASKMYVDCDGKTYHVGYVIRNRWFTAFTPLERECKP